MIQSDVEVMFRSGGVDVAASLRTPAADAVATAAGTAPVAAAVLVAGSGPVDRDENADVPGPLGDLRIDSLRWLADQLSELGIATLRYDKLGVGGTGPAPFGSPELQAMDFADAYVQPARDALAFLADQPGIDADRLALVGHSEGACIALAVVVDPQGAPAASRLAMVEPGYRRLFDEGRRQVVERLQALGLADDVFGALLAWVDRGVTTLRTTEPPFPAPEPPPFPDAASPIADAQQLIQATLYGERWGRLGQTADRLDPPALAPQVRVPTLVTVGTKDFNTPLAEPGGEGVGTLAASFADGVAELAVIPDMHHILRDIGDAPVGTSLPEAVAHPWSEPFAAAFRGFFGEWATAGSPV